MRFFVISISCILVACAASSPQPQPSAPLTANASAHRARCIDNCRGDSYCIEGCDALKWQIEK